MNKRKEGEGQFPDIQRHPVPFTARLTAYHRAQETERSEPLLVDPFAERLAGDLTSYEQDHRYTTRRGNYPIIRSYYIEEELLRTWCNEVTESAIVLLGAGLDSRAYRFKPLKKNSHAVYELDLPAIVDYKEAVLRNEEPLCSLIRVPVDLSKAGWDSLLLNSGFSTSIPTFWILEGLLYYLSEKEVTSLLKKLAEISHKDSRIFADVCEPALAESKFGPFLRHFQWGIAPKNITGFFAETGWAVSWSYAHKHDQGRDVGQRGHIFVNGKRSALNSKPIPTASIPETQFEYRTSSSELFMGILTEIEKMVQEYEEDSAAGFESYLCFVERYRELIETILQRLGNPEAISQISPRLLRDPLYLDDLSDMNRAEQEAHVTAYLRAFLRLMYWNLKRIDSWRMPENLLHPEEASRSSNNQVESLIPLIQLVQEDYRL